VGFFKHIAAFGLAFGMGIGSLSALAPLHPFFTIRHILPTEMANIGGIGGIGLLANGDGVIATWGGSQKSMGEVWIVPALATGTPGTPTRIATGLREALGVAVVGADFYVLEKPRILKFTGSGTTWAKSTLWSLPSAWYNDDQWHHFSMNLVYKDDGLWFTTGMAFEPDSNDPIQRGALIKVQLNGSGFSQFARGMRNTNGLGVGPEDEFFITDNQGHWKPVNAMYWVPTKGVPIPANGRFYGYRTLTNNACKLTPPPVSGSNCPTDEEFPPAVWLPYGSVTHSPTRPILLKEGPYAGQMIGGDVFHGGTLRYFLEKVEGEWQGAVFSMMSAGAAGTNFGINQFLYTPTGSLLVAGIGGGNAVCGLGGSDNWNWNGTCRGLDLLTPTGATAFEILAIRALKDGFDIEFTQPANAAAGLAANWTVRTTVFTPVFQYGGDGGNNDNAINVAISEASLSTDGKHVRLKLASMETKRMYAITAKTAVQSATGSVGLYNAAGHYTLNKVPLTSALREPVSEASGFGGKIRGSLHRGRVVLEIPFTGAWRLELLKLDGTRAAYASGTGPRRFETAALPVGLYVMKGHAANGGFAEKIQVH
jgi:hypothetical protein